MVKLDARASVESKAGGEDVITRGRVGGGVDARGMLGEVWRGADKVSSDALNVVEPLSDPEDRGWCPSVFV